MPNILGCFTKLLIVFVSVLSLCSCFQPGQSSYGYYAYRSLPNTRKPVTNNQHLNRVNRSDRSSTSFITAPSAEEPPGRDSRIHRISKEDADNAKFLGGSNLEPDIDSPKTFGLLKRKYWRKRLRPYRCYPYARDAAEGKTRPTSTTSQAEGRFLWDVNVYNVYPNKPLYGCGGHYGGGLFGGGLHDSFGGDGGQQFDPVYPESTPFADFLRLFVPGVLQNALAATVRPPSSAQALNDAGYSDSGPTDEAHDLSDSTVDPAVDPNYSPQLPQRRPNRLYYDSAGAPPLTPAQLVGGVATTVNGIIQQLSGNVQPVYPNPYRRSRSYG